jgi:hypothetical protein
MPIKARTYFSQHSLLTGLALVIVGLLGVYGSLTGYLAEMIAALFDPEALNT